MPQITITIPETNPIDQQATERKLNVIANLPAEDLNRIAQIADNPKALKTLKEKWTMLKMMF